MKINKYLFSAMSIIIMLIFTLGNAQGLDKETNNQAVDENVYYEDAIEIATAKALENVYNDKSLYEFTMSIEKADKTYAMKRMISVLTDNKVCLSINSEQLFKRYILKYAPYITDDIINKYHKNLCMMLKEEINSTKDSWTYSSTSAANYATQNYNTYNSNYPNCNGIGGDCTNFISQCLYAGGIPMHGSWYCYKLNNTYPAPSDTTQLDYSWDLADPVSPWISAPEFELKWYPIFTSDTYTGLEVYNSQSDMYDLSYGVGDVVQILEQNYWWYEGYHTMIITHKRNGDYELTYHTTNTIDRALNDIAEDHASTEYKFRFYDVCSQ
jgi:hypothetical protein